MLTSWDERLADILTKFSGDVGMIYHLNPEDNNLHLVVRTDGFPDYMIPIMSKIPIGKGIAGETAKTKKAIVANNLTGDDAPECARPLAKTMGIKGMISTPIFYGQDVVGTIGIGCFSEHQFLEQDVNDLIEIGRNLAPQLESEVAKGENNNLNDVKSPFQQGAAVLPTPILKKLSTKGFEPSERDSPAAVALDGFIYVFGGLKDDFSTGVNTFYNDLYRFDTKTYTWEALSPTGELPQPRGYASAVALQNEKKILLYGGTSYEKDFSNLILFNDLWLYSVDKNSWKSIHATTEGPSARTNSKTWFYEDKLYLFGGVNGLNHKFNDLWVFDLKTNSWTEIIANQSPHSPPAVHKGQGYWEPIRGKLVMYAVSERGEDDLVNETWEFDLKTEQWRNITPSKNNIMPPRTATVASIIGDNMYIQGGDLQGVGSIKECGTPFPQSATDEMWRFDTKQHEWSKLGVTGCALPRLKRAGTATYDGKMYIFSGFDFQCYGGKGPGQIWNHDVYMFTIVPGMFPNELN